MLQKKGKIWYVVLNYKEGNKWKKKWISTGTPSAREAKRIEKDIEYKATEGIIKVKAEKDIPTLRAFFDQWMDVCVKPPSRKPATYENYKYVSNKICRSLGNMKVNRITPEILEKYIKEELAAGTSHTCIRLEYRVLKVALKSAVRWKLIAVNPCEAVDPPSPTPSPAKVATIDEVQQLLDITSKDSVPINHLVICLGALAGLRRGEMCALEWADVDLDANILYIRHSMSRKDNDILAGGTYYKVFHGQKSSLVMDKVKTDASAAPICIPSIVSDALHRMKLWQNKNRILLGQCYNDNDLVLCHEDGSPCEPSYIYHCFQKLLKANNFPHLRVHDLRHTAATLLLAQGVDIKLVSHQLRHSDVSITQNLYEHVTEKLARTSADAMDDLFRKAK